MPLTSFHPVVAQWFNANFDAPSPDFLRMTLALGATLCLRKPFTPNALLAAVNECLTRPTLSAPFSK